MVCLYVFMYILVLNLRSLFGFSINYAAARTRYLNSPEKFATQPERASPQTRKRELISSRGTPLVAKEGFP